MIAKETEDNYEDAKRSREPNWDEWFVRLDECFSLKEGWNGYTAPAPNDVSIKNARALLSAMLDGHVEPTRVGPTAMGGIAVTRRTGDRKAFVECYNDGRVYLLLGDRSSDEMDVREVAVDAQSLQELVAAMREYLDAWRICRENDNVSMLEPEFHIRWRERLSQSAWMVIQPGVAE